MLYTADPFKKVRLVSNECLVFYDIIIDFVGKDVLSVLSSGDQYFASLLFGAKEVDVFDINPNTWPFFVLKFIAFRELKYDDFIKFYMEEEIRDIETYRYLSKMLPCDIKELLDRVYKEEDWDSWLTLLDDMIDGRCLLKRPYSNKESYDTIQKTLQNRHLPNFYCGNIQDLHSQIKKDYDIMLASNIFDMWYDINAKMTRDEHVDAYIELLEKYGIGIIQIYYLWGYNRFQSVFEEKCDLLKIPLAYGEYSEYVGIYKSKRKT